MLLRARQLRVLLFAAALCGCSAGPAARFAPGYSPIESQLLAEIAFDRGEYAEAINHYLNVARQSDDPEHARRATELSFEYGFDAHALAAAERWVELDAASQVARALLGILQVRFGRLESAWDNLATGLGPPAQRTDQVYTALAGDLTPAARHGRDIFARFNKTFPDTPGITRSLAELSVQAGDLPAGIEAARHTLSLRPDWIATRVWLARLLLADGQRTSAFEQMAFALDMDRSVELELEFVNLLVAAGELAEAAARLERMSERYPDDDAVVMAGAQVLAEAGRIAEAEAIYAQMLAAGRCLNDCYWYLGNLALQREDYQQALGFYRRVGAGEWLQPAVIARSQVYLAGGDAQTALEVLENFAADYPKRAVDMLYAQAYVLRRQKRFDAAAELLAEALEYRPWSEELWLVYGGSLEQGGQLATAVEAFRRAWELAPDNATTQNAYGYTLALATRRYQEAEALIVQALEQEPENPAYMDSMGWVLFKQGKRDSARAWLEQAFARLNDPEIAAHLGELLWVSGERDSARKILQEAQTAFPDNRVLQQTVERLLR